MSIKRFYFCFACENNVIVEIFIQEDLFSSFQITEEDVAVIRALGRDERIAERIFKSIAPSLYGHADGKLIGFVQIHNIFTFNCN